MGVMENNTVERPTHLLGEQEPTDEPKDRTKWIWLGVFLLLGAMVATLWIAGRTDPKVSMVRSKHILIQFNNNDPADRTRALDLAMSLRERLVRGERFESLAKEYSNDPGSSRRGGDLGYYPKDSFAEAFEKYVWTAPVGQLSEILETPHGFHLVIVEDRYLTKEDEYEMQLDERARKELEKTPTKP